MTTDDVSARERALALSLCAPDAAAAVRAAAREDRLPEGWRENEPLLDDDGLRMTALLVAKLRFERLVNGSARASAWFDADAASFTEAFRAYHEEVEPTAFFPQDEARLFEAWLSSKATRASR